MPVIHFLFFCIAYATLSPSSVKIKGPFVSWTGPNAHNGEIVRYELRVGVGTGDSTIVEKNKTDVYHLLAKEDAPANLGGATSVAIQVSGGEINITQYYQIFMGIVL